jgi:ribose transport system substrate-binding protein
MGEKGNLAILDGPDNNLTAQSRAQGFREALKEFPSVKLAAAKSASYSRTQASTIVKDLLRSNAQLDGIVAANDPMAIGAAQAVKAAGRKVLIAGINASREVMDYIKSSEITGSGDYDTFEQGCLGVEMAARHVRKEATPAEVMLKPRVIDKTNLTPFDQPYEKRQCPSLTSATIK